MKFTLKTDEYTIYQKRSERYAIRRSNDTWVNGDEKVIILLEHKLIEAAAPKPPEPEAVEEPVEDVAESAAAVVEDADVKEEAAEEKTTADTSAEDTPAEETPVEETPVEGESEAAEEAADEASPEETPVEGENAAADETTGEATVEETPAVEEIAEADQVNDDEESSKPEKKAKAEVKKKKTD